MRKLYLLFLLGLAHLSFGQVHYVNLNASGNNDGTSWESAFTDLQDALNAAMDGDEIWIAAGTYSPDVSGAGLDATFRVSTAINIYGGFNGTETSADQRNTTVNKVWLSGDILNNDTPGDFTFNRDDNVHHVVTVVPNIIGKVGLYSLHIIAGHGMTDTDPNGDRHLGGGVIASSAVEIRSCLFNYNFARAGASVALLGAGCDNPFIGECSVVKNRSSSQSAGFFMNEVQDVRVQGVEFVENEVTRGAIYPLRSNNITIHDCSFRDNVCNAAEGFGGAIFLWNSQNVSITNTEVQNSVCGNGAGMYVDGRELAQGVIAVTLENCQFVGNEAGDYGGGGIYGFRANVDMTNCLFSENMAANTGAGMYHGGNNKTVRIQNCQFLDNTSSGGWGGAHAVYGDTSRVLVNESSYEGNTAVTSGGAVTVGFGTEGIYNQCNFDGNSASFGGASYSQNDSSEVDFINCDFIGNTAATFGGAIYIASAGNNRVSGCTFELNVSDDSGGGLGIADPDPEDADTAFILVDACNFDQNLAETQGGGLYISNANVDLINTLMANNTVFSDFGGAISHNGGSGGHSTLNILNSTLYNNLAEVVSGIASYTDGIGTAEVITQNAIISHEDGTDWGIEDGSPTMVSMGGNLIGNSDFEPIFNQTNDLLGEEPGFVDADNLDFQLRDDSPCVNTGVNDNAPPTDILGNGRVGNVDKGAYENQIVVSNDDIILEASNFVVFPNPVDEVLSAAITWPQTAQKVTLGLFDAAGRLVFMKSTDLVKGENQLTYTVDFLSSGSYRLEILDAGIQGGTTIIKK
jgi:predicted outer membrane repeat protein